MELRHSIFRRGKKGGDFAKNYTNKWVLRFVWRDDMNAKCEKSFTFRTEQDAKDARPRLEAELMKTGGRKIIGDKMTFLDLADYAKRTIYAPAEIVNGRKIAGVKSADKTHSLINTLAEFFENKKLSEITRNDMERFKVWRYKQGDRRGHQKDLKPKDRKPVSASSVNRALAIFTRLMKYAHAEGWVSRDITLGSKAIDRDAEKAKSRTLTAAEESRLLAACGGERHIAYKRKGKSVTATVNVDNPYLKAAILFGLDAGLRKREILTLDWSNVDLDRGLLNVQSRHTKTEDSRTVGLTNRLKRELQALPNFGEEGRIFPFNDFKRSFATALRLAKIEGLTFHDLRRTFVTILNRTGTPLAFAGKFAGHSTLATTQKHYVSTDDLAIIEETWRRLEAAQEQQDEGDYLN